MTWREYQANPQGLNIFFGAVLGFVLAGMNNLKPLQFAVLLAAVSGIVVGILYVTSSRHRLLYALLAAAMILYSPHVLESIIHAEVPFPQNLQPTLAVWLAMTAIVEFMPREPDDREKS
jgi:ABC-type uncharacterized transport system permease subunit